jgi:hypothetical protein
VYFIALNIDGQNYFFFLQTIVNYGRKEVLVKDFYNKPYLRPRTQVVDEQVVLTSVFHGMGGRGLDNVIGSVS